MKLKSEFRKKLLAAFLGISICLPLNAAYANTISYTIQGIETRFQREGDEFTKTDGIDLSKEFFIGLDWGSTELNHINLYYTPVTYTSKSGCLFRAGKLYAMTNAYRFGYTASKSQVMDIGYAQAILAGYADFSETQLAKMQEMIMLGNQTMESGFYITLKWYVHRLIWNRRFIKVVVENDLPTSDDTFITRSNSLVEDAAFSGNDTVIQDLVISSDSFMSNLSVDDNVAADVEQVPGDKTVSNVGNDKTLVKKTTMRERISRILQETRLDVFLDSDNNEEITIDEKPENNTVNDVFLEDDADDSNNSTVSDEENYDTSDIIAEARRVREQLALLIK